MLRQMYNPMETGMLQASLSHSDVYEVSKQCLCRLNSECEYGKVEQDGFVDIVDKFWEELIV
jgi:hypothetical protein